jgi:hypothetical protein
VRSRPKSCSFAVIVTQQSAQSFAACDLTRSSADFLIGVEQLVSYSLMIPLRMIVLNLTECGGLQGFFAEENHALQALLLKASHEPLNVRIQIWRSRR